MIELRPCGCGLALSRDDLVDERDGSDRVEAKATQVLKLRSVAWVVDHRIVRVVVPNVAIDEVGDVHQVTTERVVTAVATTTDAPEERLRVVLIGERGDILDATLLLLLSQASTLTVPAKGRASSHRE